MRLPKPKIKTTKALISPKLTHISRLFNALSRESTKFNLKLIIPAIFLLIIGINLYTFSKTAEAIELTNNIALKMFPHDINLLRQKDELYVKTNKRKLINLLISKWEKIARKYPGYRDAYARLAYLNLEAGKREEAKKYLEIVKKINPNWPELEKFQL